MLQLLIAILLLAIGLFWFLTLKDPEDESFGQALVSGIIGGGGAIWLITLLISMSTGPAQTRAKMKEMEAVRTTIQQQRLDSLTGLERVHLTQTIVTWNAWLADAQFWATNPWTNLYHDKSVLTVKPIE